MKKLIIVAIVCTTFGCGFSFAGDVPIDLGTCVNRSAKTPWPNQVPYGYREWLPKEIIFKETVFQFTEKRRVLVLKPKEFITIDLPYPVPIEGVEVIASSNFSYKHPLHYTIELLDVTAEKKMILKMKARDWFPWTEKGVFAKEDVVMKLRIFGDGQYANGLIAHEKKDVSVVVSRLRILNDKAKSNQHLLIAAVTLKQLPIVPVRYIPNELKPKRLQVAKGH